MHEGKGQHLGGEPSIFPNFRPFCQTSVEERPCVACVGGSDVPTPCYRRGLLIRVHQPLRGCATVLVHAAAHCGEDVVKMVSCC